MGRAEARSISPIWNLNSELEYVPFYVTIVIAVLRVLRQINVILTHRLFYSADERDIFIRVQLAVVVVLVYLFTCQFKQQAHDTMLYFS